MKKTLLTLVAILSMIVALFLTVKFIEKKLVERHFTTYLEEHNYQNDVFSKETKYDVKMGKFYMKVFYENYPDREYHYYYLSLNTISGAAYEKGAQIKTTAYLEGLEL